MTIESDVKALVDGDATISGLLTGGVHVKETVGRLGITRESVPSAFDASGFLLPCMLIRERTRTRDMAVTEIEPSLHLLSQNVTVELYLYQDTDYDTIYSVMDLLIPLLHGTQLTNTFGMRFMNEMRGMQDPGALMGASMARQDWIVPLIQGV